MNSKPNILTLSDGTQATLILAEPVTPQRIAILEDALPALFRTMRGQAQSTSTAGAIEYDSWLNAGALEYDSWRNAL
jgi:hypothetical protein